MILLLWRYAHETITRTFINIYSVLVLFSLCSNLLLTLFEVFISSIPTYHLHQHFMIKTKEYQTNNRTMIHSKKKKTSCNLKTVCPRTNRKYKIHLTKALSSLLFHLQFLISVSHLSECSSGSEPERRREVKQGISKKPFHIVVENNLYFNSRLLWPF